MSFSSSSISSISSLNYNNNQIINKKIREEIKKCQYSSFIMLSNCYLNEFPLKIITLQNDIKYLRRLDLSFNNITSLPNEISELSELKELWLQHNPLITIPVSLSFCSKLEIIDLKFTKIIELPSELCNLKKLYELNYENTPFSEYILQRYEIKTNGINGLATLKRIFQEIYERQCLKSAIIEKLLGELYMKELDNPDSLYIVENMVEQLNTEFTNLEEFRLFSRRADKLLPQSLAEIDENTIHRTKEKFLTMRDNTKRDRMAAEVEIKLRSIYFDRIERETVESVINSIFQSVKTLEDMQFLVKYASQVFPTSPDDANGETIWRNILNLQQDLTNKREAAIHNLVTVMYQIYPEQLPSEVEKRGREIAKGFQKDRFATKRELNLLSRLTADSSQIFPPDFVSATVNTITETARNVFGRN